MKRHSQAPSLPREVPHLVGGMLFLPFGNSQPEAGESKVVVTQGSEPQAAAPPKFKTEQGSNALRVAGGEYTWGSKVIRDWDEAREV